MIDRLGLRVSAVFRRTAPDPFVLAIVLTILAAALALTLGYPADVDGVRPGAGDRLLRLLDAWRGEDGVWRFLAFGMQMCLILVTGHALAASRPVRALLDRLARLPRSTRQGVVLVSVTACVAALVNWGLGLIVGAILARSVGRSLSRRGVPLHYPLVCAAGYTGLLVWHGGLSGSAPLTVTTLEGAAKVLPAGTLQRLGEGGIPLSETILSPMNLFVTLGLVVLTPMILALMVPKRMQDVASIQEFVEDEVEDDVPGPDDPAGAATPAERLDRSWVVAWLLVLPLGVALARFVGLKGLDSVGLNEINAAMLALGLACHGSARSYMQAVEQGARGCAGIIVQFPLYGGIMGMLAASGLVARFARELAAGGEQAVPMLTFLAAAVINLFVPSGGGQWGIQGPVALEAGLAAGVEPGKMVMAVAYGDELTNMLQPFWALPLLAITGVKARDMVGYTAVLMLGAGVWMAVGLLLF